MRTQIYYINYFSRLGILFLLLMVISFIPWTLYSQNVSSKPTRQSSLEAFSKNNYEQAYLEFKELLVTYTKDPLYKYYSGVCLVKLNRNPEEAESLMKQALQGAALVRNLPSDALFYLGRAQQMAGKFVEATGTYNLFVDQVGKKTSKEYNVAEFIQQCSEKKGKIGNTEPVLKEEIKIVDVQPVPVAKEDVPEPVVKPDTSERKDIPRAFDRILNDALEFQTKADSLKELASQQKRQLDKLDAAERNSMKSSISENEAAAISFQKSADEKYNEAQMAINGGSENVRQITPDQTVRIEEKKDTVQRQIPENRTAKVEVSSDIEKKNAEQQTLPVKKEETLVNKQVEVYSVFEVLPGPVTDPKEKILIDGEVPPGLIYRIQIAVFRNPVAPVYFKGITPIYGFKVAGTDRTNYFAGMFRRSADASKALTVVKAKGFKDAFVVALSGNKPVSTDRATLLEKEWGNKPIFTQMKMAEQSPADTIPPTLAFRVEVLRVLKPVKEDVVEAMKKIAGNRGFDIFTLDDGNIVYLIGNFITFESAVEYSDLLVRNGYREAKVGAWLGRKELPLETARQLFENLE